MGNNRVRPNSEKEALRERKRGKWGTSTH